MDLEVVGRHALLFDDDSMAAFVNSSAALVEWNTLFIDRYDVRHLLSSPPPPRSKRRRQSYDDPDLASELDHERYLDLPADSPSPPPDQKDLNDVSAPANSSGFHAVPFSYGNSIEANDHKNADTESGFRPPFAVPESLLLNLPPTEKLHQIIARTALFVSKHGGQSEIVLRVKQGGNPTFGFLMPDHHLHPYFRFLVDHQELLTGKSFEEDKNNEGGQAGGALSLLGSVYGTGEDEDTKNEAAEDGKINESVDADDTVKPADSDEPERVEGTKKLAAKESTVSRHPLLVKDKASVIKRNPSVSAVNIGDTSMKNNESDTSEKLSSSTDKSQAPVLRTPPKFELPIVEPPADLKRVIDKIVEFILRNGKEFEAILAEQDVKYGRFPFLLPASLYHAYYRKVLQEAEESKSSGKSSISEKQDNKQEKKANAAREDDEPAIGTEIPDDSAKKEKFKMVIGKPKRDVQDEPAKPFQPQIGVTVDADAAAAILQAARRGIKNPNLGILSSNPLDETSQVLGSGSHPSSCLTKNIGQINEQLVSGPAANAIAKTAAIAACSEADSSEAGLTKEQKLKAERLRRAKMFVAMIKGGADPSKAEPARSLSVELSDSGISGSGAKAVEPAAKERGGSLVPSDAEKKLRDDDFSERRSKRKYRSRSGRNEIDEEEEDVDEEDTEETKEDKRPSRKRHSDHSRDRHKHKRRHSSKDRDSQGRHKHNIASDDEHHKHSRHRHKRRKSSHKHDIDDSSDNEHHHQLRSSNHKRVDSSGDECRHRHRSSNHKHADSAGDERRHRHRSSKHKRDDSSEDDQRGHWRRSSKHRNRERKPVDEWTFSKLDQSKAKDDRKDSREASVDLAMSSPDGEIPSEQNETAQVSDELRAKIRAMLMGTM